MALGTMVGGRLGAVAVFVGAAVLEVVGDALIRIGLRSSGLALIALGLAVLGGYGIVVNLLDLDFSRLLGAYVGIFAVVSVLFGRIVFQERVPPSTWVGLKKDSLASTKR